MTKQEEIQVLLPDVMEGIQESLQDAHLGRMFSSKLVKKSLKGINDNTLSRWFYRCIVNLKEFWWVVKSPWQRYISHRNCPICKGYRENKKES